MSSSQSPRQSPTQEEKPVDVGTISTREKQGDKRKAPETDSLNLDLTGEFTSLQTPSKKPRIQASSSFTPSKTPVMSPLCVDDESPSKFITQTEVADISQSDILDFEINLGVHDEDQSLLGKSRDNKEVKTGTEFEVNLSRSFDHKSTIPSPVNIVEVEVEDSSVKVSKEGDVGSDSDSGRFFTHIRQKEEQQQKHKDEQQLSGKSSSSYNPVVALGAPVSADVKADSSGSDTTKKKEKDKGESSRRGGATSLLKSSQSQKKKATDNKSSHSNSSSYSSSVENSSSSQRGVEFSLQIFDEKSHVILYDTKDGRVKSDFNTMMEFLKNHKIEISSLTSTGYSADVSSPESITFDFLNTPQRPRTTSLGSSIPRPSDASTISRPSITGIVQGMKKPTKPQPRPPRRPGDIEPILSSTRITEYKSTKNGASTTAVSTNKAKLELTLESSSKNKTTPVSPVTNGGDHSNVVKITGQTERGRLRVRRDQSSPAIIAVKSHVKHAPTDESSLKSTEKSMSIAKGNTSLEGEGSILMFSGASDTLNVTGTPQLSQSEVLSTAENSSTSVSTSEADLDVVKRIKHEAMDDTQAQGSKVRQALGAAKGLAEEFNEPEFVKSATLWGAIQVGESVFGRWRDKNYYSGRIIKKGMNDTWYIHFEDDMEDVASETHILPVKILGTGTRSVYCPSEVFKPEEVIIVGQRFMDPVEDVEYAVVSDVDGRRINCLRKNLILKEFDAKELRKQYQIPNSGIFKTSDVNLDNIVTGPRRRAGAGPPAPSDQIRKLIADAFDSSTADEHLLLPWTPTPKKATGGHGTRRGSGASGTESNTSDDTRKSNDGKNVTTVTPSTGTSGISKTPSSTATSALIIAGDTPNSSTKDSSKKVGKGKEKPLFHGMQFFLTASGGGDPSSSGTSAAVPLVTYDKDEYRETIENKGGSVVNLVGRENNKGKSQIYLISDSHARTVKYIYCLAAGIPCVSSLWIGECLQQNAIVDWKPFELNSGWSLEEGTVIPAHQKKPLKDIRIYVTAESEELYNYWKPVLTAAQANLLKPLKSRKKPTMVPPDTEVLVTDATCTPEILELAQVKGIPVVKPEWLVQTIITGQKAEYAGHEKYQVGISDVELGEEEAEDEEESEN